MMKIQREILRLAQREGIEKPHITPGDPHARLSGLYLGRSFSIVVSLSKSFGGHRTAGYNKANIRKIKRKIEGAP
jgi:hypothetical protein